MVVILISGFILLLFVTYRDGLLLKIVCAIRKRKEHFILQENWIWKMMKSLSVLGHGKKEEAIRKNREMQGYRNDEAFQRHEMKYSII